MDEIYVQLKTQALYKRFTIRSLVKKDLPALEWEGEFIHYRNVFADVYKKVEKDTARPGWRLPGMVTWSARFFCK